MKDREKELFIRDAKAHYAKMHPPPQNEEGLVTYQKWVEDRNHYADTAWKDRKTGWE